jgi:hypothetical protein
MSCGLRRRRSRLNQRRKEGSVRKIKTEADAPAAVAQNGWALKYAPEALKTAEVCMEAVRRNGRALAFTPEALRGEVRAALEKEPPAKTA